MLGVNLLYLLMSLSLHIEVILGSFRTIIMYRLRTVQFVRSLSLDVSAARATIHILIKHGADGFNYIISVKSLLKICTKCSLEFHYIKQHPTCYQCTVVRGDVVMKQVKLIVF